MVTLFWIVLFGSPFLFLWLYLRHREQYEPASKYARSKRTVHREWADMDPITWMGYPDPQIFMEDMGWDDDDF